MKKQIVSNIASHYALNFIGMVLGFLLIPFLIRKVGSEAFGLIVLAESMSSFFEILTVSLRISMSRQATIAAAEGNQERYRNFLATGHTAMSACALLTLIVGSLVATFFPQLFRVPAGLEADSMVLVFFVFLSFSLSERNAVYWAALYAKQRFDLIHMSTSTGLLLRAGIIFGIYLFMPDGQASILPYTCVGLLMVLSQTAIVRYWHTKLWPGMTYPYHMFKRKYLREILSFGGHFSIIRLSQVLYADTATILINLWWGPAANTIYAITGKLSDIMQRIFIQPTWSLTPTFTDLAARHDKDRLERLFFSYSKLLSILSAPCCLILLLLSHSLIHIWLGPDFKLAGDLLPLASIWLILGIPFCLSGGVLNAYGHVRLPSFISLSSAILNFILCFVFGKMLNMGLFGVVLAGAIASNLLPNFFSPYYACRMAGLSLRRYWTEVFIKPFGLSALLCGGGLLVAKALLHNDLLLVGTGGVLALLSYAVCFGILLSQQEKDLASEMLGSVLSRFKRSPKVITKEG